MHEAPKRDPFLIPGRTDASMAPRLGALNIHQIKHMPEGDVDARIYQHTKGASPFNARNGTSLDPVRRLELKRQFLAMLEGHSPSNADFIAWVDEGREADTLLTNPSNRVHVDRIHYASKEVQRRIKEVRSMLPDVALRAPQQHELRILGNINHILYRHELGPLALNELLSSIAIGPRTTTVKNLLRIYEMRLHGMPYEAIEKSLGLAHGTCPVFMYRHFTPHAKDLLRRVRGKR